ncbi:ESX secretion-associated protein EspG [Nocardia brasiliensis]|uniref:ESX secretion-associated protein EspG n=1 Tax=Nocardia brasiliensis TaxID=37326 RepID=A0A6G9Y3B3_NOCBR|nr:ESX secretion-associated protein EspG [Nocardia brasiliensis]QIS07600.1 ESX secretion-associated protein EspG [Nocardia brasiliensis]
MVEMRFTGLEFQLLWQAYGRDRLPYPLRFRPQAVDFADLVAQRDAAAAALLDRHSIELERALGILLEPEVRIEIKGFGAPELTRIYRFHGAVRDDAAATLVQLPGDAEDTGGAVALRYCAAAKAAAYAVAALPDSPPGTHPTFEARRAEITADRERPVRGAYEVGPAQRFDRLFKRERRALGEITVLPGPAVDARPTFGRGFWWMDYPDGRYYVKTGDPVIAKPMDAAAMAAEIRRLTTLTQRYYREDREHDEYLRTRR